ncbi:polysaccharide deacetylase family protein [Paracoccus sp. MBLB3053]|uniref:Chitooligosaccharide deacetylase n=1 Tax=Paracoccus aurantius TaxID=3073814 RepID=A0ABU2HYD5_9RHOB|nr:polysaccharide deacetylase family protein [Paracoccus sp. MBLB3053]MDS9470058.1 polysaccharide deacetylase family protein [Paracoccus sp. MBLB3053]
MTHSLRAYLRILKWRLAFRRLFASKRGGLILLYHRVHDCGADPWRMAVRPESFDRQMAVLGRLGLASNVSELAEHLAQDTPGAPRIAVSFDDGYVDNKDAALPILERYGVPATFYITSGAIGHADAFWWDRLHRIFLEEPRLPRDLALTFADGRTFQWCLGAEAAAGPDLLAACKAWSADLNAPSGPRQRLMRTLWEMLEPLEAAERQPILQELDRWSGTAPPADERPMTKAELREFARSPLVEIGGHTRNHVDLGRVAPEVATREIAEDRQALRDLTGQDLRSFALPFGRMGRDTRDLILKAGYSSATTSRSGRCEPGSDLMQLPRLQVEEMPIWMFESLISAVAGR